MTQLMNKQGMAIGLCLVVGQLLNTLPAWAEQTDLSKVQIKSPQNSQKDSQKMSKAEALKLRKLNQDNEQSISGSADSSGTSANSVSGGIATGGGSFAEQDFAKSGWQKYYRMQRMRISPDDLAELEKTIKMTKPIETEKELIFQGQVKNALNFRNGVVSCEYLYCPDPKQKYVKFNSPVIVFNSISWKGSKANEKPGLAFHEYMGILNADRNNYEISARLEASDQEDRENQAQKVQDSSQEEASLDTIQIFLNGATQRLDEINALLAVNLDGEALAKAEILKAQILKKLAVDTRTDARHANIQIALPKDEKIENFCSGWESSRWAYALVELRDIKNEPLFDLIQFNKLFAITYHEAYVKKTGTDDLSNYLRWVDSFRISVEFPACGDSRRWGYIKQSEVFGTDYYNYVNLTFYKKTGLRYETVNNIGTDYIGHDSH